MFMVFPPYVIRLFYNRRENGQVKKDAQLAEE
jgi:hypothetical protein